MEEEVVIKEISELKKYSEISLEFVRDSDKMICVLEKIRCRLSVLEERLKALS